MTIGDDEQGDDGQEGCKVRENVILSAAKNLRGRHASPRLPRRFFAALRMTVLSTLCEITTLQVSWESRRKSASR
jgi:hypothetical protein